MTIARTIAAASVALLLIAPAGAHDARDELDEIAGLMKLRPGMRLADVGAGDGEFAEALAERVGPLGHVFANEIDDGELRKIRRRIERSGLSNLTAVEGGAKDARLPVGSCDGILLRYVYHHISEREAMRSSLRRSLRPGGVLVMIEKKESGGHGITLDKMVEEMTADGFRLISRHAGWGDHKNHHAAVFAPLP